MRYVAFLRAVNVANRRIKMADLRAVYEDLGYTNVATHMATGNVIFDSPSPPLVHYLELVFEERFGFDSEVFLRTGEYVRSIPAHVPWSTVDQVVEVSFLETAPGPDAVKALEETAVDPEALTVVETEVLFLRGLGRGVPTIHKEATSMRLLGMKMTRRGLATVEAIVDRYLYTSTPTDCQVGDE